MAHVRVHHKDNRFRKKVGVMPDFSGASLITQEEPIGALNGKNSTFTLSHIPVEDSEMIYKDGMRLRRATNDQFTDGDYWLDYKSTKFYFSPEHIPTERSVLLVGYRYL